MGCGEEVGKGSRGEVGMVWALRGGDGMGMSG